MRIDSRRTFRTIVTGSTNQRALALARQVARGAVVPNPLLLLGRSGVGKSLVLHAMANALTRRGCARVVMLTAEEFRHDYVTAIRSGTIPAFRNGLDTADALIVDGAEDFAAFTSAFAELHRAMTLAVARHVPVVLACGKAFCGEVAEAVRAFPSGAYAALQPATLTQRMTSLERLARARRRKVSRTHVASIARTCPTIGEARAKLDAVLLAQRLR